MTIGVYGFDESRFFEAILEAKVDTFCDIRSRRGMRGAKYAFANSLYLQDRLSKIGIRYLHLKNLAPTKTIRDKQTLADKQTGTLKRDRNALSESFIKAYQTECLSDFSSRDFVSSLEENTEIMALFCVERIPDACHRSLVAAKLADEIGLQVLHIKPT